jgi:hypothetical protein
VERMSYVKEYKFCMKNSRNRDDGLGFLRCYSDKFTLPRAILAENGQRAMSGRSGWYVLIATS